MVRSSAENSSRESCHVNCLSSTRPPATSSSSATTLERTSDRNPPLFRNQMAPITSTSRMAAMVRRFLGFARFWAWVIERSLRRRLACAAGLRQVHQNLYLALAAQGFQPRGEHLIHTLFRQDSGDLLLHGRE